MQIFIFWSFNLVVCVFGIKTAASIMATFKEAFKGNEQWLTENLEVSDSLLDALKDKQIIIESHVNDVKNADGKSQKVVKLLHILECCDDALFSKFCEVLAAAGQPIITQLLLKEADTSIDDGATRVKRGRFDEENYDLNYTETDDGRLNVELSVLLPFSLVTYVVFHHLV
jgi:hypothetical protein